jgi:hypothetical protein
MDAGFYESEAFAALARVFIEKTNCTTFSAHPIRVIAPGKPAPEGPHTDGVEFQAIYVVSRTNIQPGSARTQIFDRENKLAWDGFLQPGDMLFFNDAENLHNTFDIEANIPGLPAFRDVIIFSTPDHEHYSEQRYLNKKQLNHTIDLQIVPLVNRFQTCQLTNGKVKPAAEKEAEEILEQLLPLTNTAYTIMGQPYIYG